MIDFEKIMNDSSIVIELQQLATDSNQNIGDLLRKALLVATKLNLHEFKEWTQKELSGYRSGDEIPPYRDCYARVMIQSHQGLIPIVFPNTEIEKTVSHRPIYDSIGSLCSILNNAGLEDIIFFQMPPEIRTGLAQFLDPRIQQLPIYWVLYRNQIASIFDDVRNAVLDWALKLESEGILGNGLAFSEDEKRKASSSTVFQHVENLNFQGVLGSVEHSNLTQNLQMTISKGDIAGLRDYLTAQKILPEDIKELENAIKEDSVPTNASKFGEKVSNWIGKMVGKAAAGGWDVAVAVAGQLLANAIAAYYGLR
jgi:hypothetical protein